MAEAAGSAIGALILPTSDEDGTTAQEKTEDAQQLVVAAAAAGPMTKATATTTVPFRTGRIPVTYSPAVVSHATAQLALASVPFRSWLKRCERKRSNDNKCLDVHSIELQSVDLFGTRYVVPYLSLQWRSNSINFWFPFFILLMLLFCFPPPDPRSSCA
jgi:integral membrane sensor domain MASE1